MTNESQTLDPIWEEIYSEGHTIRAPWDAAVSFIYSYMPRNVPRKEIKIMEVGCGPASNLWFAALEGFDVTGIDGSAAAIKQARQRFQQDGIKGTLEVGDFTELAFDDNSFDLLIDRGALTCAGTQAQKKAIQEAYRVLKPGGYFLYTPFADTHYSSQCGTKGPDDLILNINGGTVHGVGQLRFIAELEIPDFLPKTQWTIEAKEYHTYEDLAKPEQGLHSCWKIIAQKRA